MAYLMLELFVYMVVAGTISFGLALLAVLGWKELRRKGK